MVGEFTADPAMTSTSTKSEDNGNERVDSEGRPRLGAHGIRVGDIVRVNDISSRAGKKSGSGKEKGRDAAKSAGSLTGAEGVVTRVGDRSVWVAFGQRGGSGRSKDDDEAVEELWGKKLWLYAFIPTSFCLYCEAAWMDCSWV